MLDNQPIAAFAIVGAITTLIDLVLFAALTHGFSLAPVVANPLSYSCGIVTSFCLNRAWTFRRQPYRSGFWQQALRFGMSNAAGLLISTLLVATLAIWQPALWAKVLSVPVVFVWNYLLARIWVFR